MNKTKKIINKGFTLIELMVVIAIIGMLSAIAVPIILTVQRDSRDSQRLKQLDAVRIAAASFYTQYNADIDIYTNNNCTGRVSRNPTQPTRETNTYYVCKQTVGSGDSGKQFQVTLTDGYYLALSSNGVSCGPNDKSVGKKVVFAIDRGAPGSSTGKLLLCKEGGGFNALEYKQQ